MLVWIDAIGSNNVILFRRNDESSSMFRGAGQLGGVNNVSGLVIVLSVWIDAIRSNNMIRFSRRNDEPSSVLVWIDSIRSNNVILFRRNDESSSMLRGAEQLGVFSQCIVSSVKHVHRCYIRSIVHSIKLKFDGGAQGGLSRHCDHGLVHFDVVSFLLLFNCLIFLISDLLKYLSESVI